MSQWQGQGEKSCKAFVHHLIGAVNVVNSLKRFGWNYHNDEYACGTVVCLIDVTTRYLSQGWVTHGHTYTIASRLTRWHKAPTHKHTRAHSSYRRIHLNMEAVHSCCCEQKLSSLSSSSSLSATQSPATSLQVLQLSDIQPYGACVCVCVSVCERKWGNVWELQWHNWMDMCAETCGGGGERRRSSPNKNRGQSSFMVKRSSTCDLKCHGNFFGHLEEEGITHTPISRNINISERSSEIHWSTCYKTPCCWETSSPEICCCTPRTPSGW